MTKEEREILEKLVGAELKAIKKLLPKVLNDFEEAGLSASNLGALIQHLYTVKEALRNQELKNLGVI